MGRKLFPIYKLVPLVIFKQHPILYKRLSISDILKGRFYSYSLTNQASYLIHFLLNLLICFFVHKKKISSHSFICDISVKRIKCAHQTWSLLVSLEAKWSPWSAVNKMQFSIYKIYIIHFDNLSWHVLLSAINTLQDPLQAGCCLF